MVGIYKVTNPKGKVYIGQSWNLERRRGTYRRLECKNQIKMYNSISKYGWKAHKFEVIHELPQDVTQEILNAYEVLYWQQYRDCKVKILNIKEPGSNGRNSRESIDRIAKALRGNKNASGSRSEEFKSRCRLNRIGKPGNMLNKKHSEESISKMKKIKIGKPAPNRKQVINTETGEIYKSLTEACEKTGMYMTTLSYYLNNVYPNKTNLKWHKPS